MQMNWLVSYSDIYKILPHSSGDKRWAMRFGEQIWKKKRFTIVALQSQTIVLLLNQKYSINYA